METTIRTVKSGKEYRVHIGVIRYTFILSDDGEMVQIYTATANLGSYYISRFGGALTPDGIRDFLESTAA